MEELSLDAIYVSSDVNHRYFSAYNNPDGWLFITRERPYVFADFRYIEAAQAEADKICKVIMPEGKRKDYLGAIIKSDSVHTIGYEDAQMTCASFKRLEADFGDICEFKPIGGLLEEIRAIKDEDEVACIVKAQRIAEAAFDHILKFMKPDMTEKEIQLEMDYFMLRNGAEAISFDTICVSGSASSMPHGVPRNVKLEQGFLTMDYGAVVDGYHSDMTRTVVIGKADEAQKKLYNTVLQAQEAALEAITCGAKNAEMDKIARDIIYGAGYEGCFGHSLGHGVGLRIHEAPGLSGAMGEAVLQAGQVVTVEPGIYIAGKYGCRIEDMVYITADGKRNLTNSPKSLIELF